MPLVQHEHCVKCFNINCQVPYRISNACLVIKCHKNCGAAFHMCKEEEHELLCPHETVPCLNVLYGCPFTMLRNKLAKHLQVCPASVVCCSQEWNRWPVLDNAPTFYKNVSEDLQSEVSLDVALALRDQKLLFQSIKMKNVFPEFMEEDLALQNIGSSGVNGSAEEACCSRSGGEFQFAENGCTSEEEHELSQDEIDALVRGRDVDGLQNYNSWEKIFKKDMEGCKETVKNLDKKEEKGKGKAGQQSSNCHKDTRDLNVNQDNAGTSSRGLNGGTGLAPWQDGVLERLGEVNIGEYNMYMAHNGAMLINFGQLAACTPREKDFVYGNLEPIEVQTVRTFNVPTSYRAKRCLLKDPSNKPKTRHCGVDTADLGFSTDDLPKCDEVSSILLCSMEKELKGHMISESVGIDGLYIDMGVQTYNFASAPFKTDATLADIIADKPPGLYVNIEEEPVNRRHNKSSSAFSYLCGHFFRRDEYCSHFRNAHSDIQASLNGWFQQRCPLAYLGCTFSQTRFHPEGYQATIKYCQDVGAFVLEPKVPSSLVGDGKSSSPPRNGTHNLGPLGGLPVEILQHIAGYLDGFTLSQLSQVSRLMREMCSTLLQDRGMVSLDWQKKTYSHGGSSWKCRKKVWEFSTRFSTVDRWQFGDIPSMSEHLKSCSFYQREQRTEPVALPCLAEVRERSGRCMERRKAEEIILRVPLAQ